MTTNSVIFIDGENLSPQLIKNYFDKNSTNIPEHTKRFIYFSETQIQFLSKKYLKLINDYHLKLIPAKEFRKGKNSADIAMSVDIIEMVFQNTSIDHFILATNDSDFTSIMIKLKEHNKEISLLCDNYQMSQSLLEHTDHILNPMDNKIMFSIPHFDKSFKILEEHIPQNKIDDEGFYNIDQVSRVAQNIFLNFSYKKAGFKKLINFIQHYKSFFLIKEIKKDDNVEYWIKLK